MNKLAMIVIFLVVSSITTAEVSTTVYLADANTPLELVDPNFVADPNVFVYRDIMVGTKLTIIVDSNVAGSWSGGLYIEGLDRYYGELSARDYNDTTLDWEGSRFQAAGDRARVWDLANDNKSGFRLGANNIAIEGDWFILDYNTVNVGICTVDFYDYVFSREYPLYSLQFSHVQTRDFNQDTKVDIADFALFSLYWLETECDDPDWCAGTDLNTDGIVDYDDLRLFADFWLEKTE